jgi:hypothetical protein
MTSLSRPGSAVVWSHPRNARINFMVENAGLLWIQTNPVCGFPSLIALSRQHLKTGSGYLTPGKVGKRRKLKDRK